jgi:hypothetical protein
MATIGHIWPSDERDCDGRRATMAQLAAGRQHERDVNWTAAAQWMAQWAVDNCQQMRGQRWEQCLVFGWSVSLRHDHDGRQQ